MQNEEMDNLELVLLAGSDVVTPLFCFPGAGGEVAVFRELAHLFAGNRSVYGIDIRRFFDSDRNFTVEQLADLCLPAIRGMQAHGPYHLCGYSFGALVAYEVAIRLIRHEERVGIVALIDTGNPAFRTQLSSAETTQLQKTYVANRLRKYMRFLISGNIRTVANSLSALFAARAGIRTRHLIRSACRKIGRPMPDVFRNNDRALFDAWKAYDPPAGALALLLYYEAHRIAEYGGDQTLGWQLCTSGQVDVELGSGGHVEMMKSPFVDRFASKLIGYLRGKAHEKEKSARNGSGQLF
jgi:thioesterase domain-containing protein